MKPDQSSEPSDFMNCAGRTRLTIYAFGPEGNLAVARSYEVTPKRGAMHSAPFPS